jgi:D-amino-acid dehydrogenase
VQADGPVDEERFDVAVIGAGAVGATVAYELAQRGARVVVVERGSGWAAGCSWGNAGIICPSHAGHYASRREIVSAAHWMLRRDSPFGVRPRAALVPFAARLFRSTSPRRAASAADLLLDLSRRSLDGHAALVQAGIESGFARRGLLDVYATGRGLQHGRAAAAAPARAVLESQVLTPVEVRQLEPALAGQLAGGVLHPHEAHCDPLRYVKAVGGAAEAAGARLVVQTEVRGHERAGSGIALQTSSGAVRADAFVIAAGVDSARIARAWGVRMPLEAGKGYTVDVERRATPLQRPLMLQEARVAVTPLDGRVRLAGTMQFDGLDLRIERSRTEAIRAAGARALPSTSGAAQIQVWAGLRPCSPDGLPLIGWLTTEPPTVMAAGHAMLGLTLAPVTGHLVADLVDGRAAPELSALDPGRFTRSRLAGLQLPPQRQPIGR